MKFTSILKMESVGSSKITFALNAEVVSSSYVTFTFKIKVGSSEALGVAPGGTRCHIPEDLSL
jgi:hypothetical protein